MIIDDKKRVSWAAYFEEEIDASSHAAKQDAQTGQIVCVKRGNCVIKFQEKSSYVSRTDEAIFILDRKGDQINKKIERKALEENMLIRKNSF